MHQRPQIDEKHLQAFLGYADLERRLDTVVEADIKQEDADTVARARQQNLKNLIIATSQKDHER
jgi:hypothetical protein